MAKIQFITVCFFLTLATVTLVKSQSENNDGDFQREAKRPGEVEYSRGQDNQFDQQVGNDRPRPRTNPSRSDVRTSFREQKDRLVREADSQAEKRQIRQDMDSVTFNPYVDYMSSAEWTSVSNNLTCCPPAWNYGCTSESVQLPCFLRSYGNDRQNQWCCPFYPTVNIKKCKCRRCAILKPKCAKAGRCQRRYKERSFYAICYKNSSWSFVRYLTTYLPSSCYCLANQ